jgi:diadenosine tetraphosphate (Ap4A) HIT family hydrolase
MIDMARIGDAILKVTGAKRINYEILGNSEPELHAHIFPRYEHEPDERRRMPVWFYDWQNAKKYSREEHGALQEELRHALKGIKGKLG